MTAAAGEKRVKDLAADGVRARVEFPVPARIEAGDPARLVPEVEALGHGLDSNQAGMDGVVRVGPELESLAGLLPLDGGRALSAPNARE